MYTIGMGVRWCGHGCVRSGEKEGEQTRHGEQRGVKPGMERRGITSLLPAHCLPRRSSSCAPCLTLP